MSEEITVYLEELEKSGYRKWYNKTLKFLTRRKIKNPARTMEWLLHTFSREGSLEAEILAKDVISWGLCVEGKFAKEFRNPLVNAGVLQWNNIQPSKAVVQIGNKFRKYMQTAWEFGYAGELHKREDLQNKVLRGLATEAQVLKDKVVDLVSETNDLKNRDLDKQRRLEQLEKVIKNPEEMLIKLEALDRIMDALMRLNPPDTPERREAFIKGDLELNFSPVPF